MPPNPAGTDRLSGTTESGYSTTQLTYDPAGRRASLASGFSTMTSSVSYLYDAAGRLQTHAHDLAGPAADQSVTFGYNAASQIVSEARTNEAYASNTAYNVNRNYSANGLNQYTAAGSAAFTYDANGNLTSDGSTTFVYDAENRLVSASGAKTAALSYDRSGRLWQVSAPSGTTRFVYDGDQIVLESDGAGSVLRAYVHGTAEDEPLIWYENGRKFLHADHQGSIVAVADQDGNKLAINGYDAWGIPNPTNIGRFGYTGQAWLPELGMWYYKARIYSATLGRFLQTDPIGYKDQVNLYAYVGNDPIDGRDPSRLCSINSDDKPVGVCPPTLNDNSRDDQFVKGRLADSNSKISEVDANATKQNKLIVIRIAEKSLPTKDAPNSSPVRGESTSKLTKGMVVVTLNPRVKIVVTGHDVGSTRIKAHTESMRELAEHAVVGHAQDMIESGRRGEQRSLDAENGYRSRTGDPFFRPDHSGSIEKGDAPE